uniref:Uncharacterized protein n=1 Tax=Anguilla anguilla TaxID=7936 RepID=A0A0E9XWH8_ANGAN
MLPYISLGKSIRASILFTSEVILK